MDVSSNDQKSVALFPSHLDMRQPLDMTLFRIVRYVLDNSTSSKKGIIMTITMKRKVLTEMMTTYFPSLLLMMITYATTFFKPFFFEAGLSVNLTTMLVMTTIFISKMEGLPPTSDIKMIDCWLVLCQLVPFVQVVLLTAVEYVREESQEETQESNNGVQNISPRKEGQEDNLELDLENEDGVINEPQEAWTLEQSKRTKPALATKLMVVGQYLKLVLIREAQNW